MIARRNGDPMITRCVLALTCLSAMAPGIASAALSIGIGPDITVSPRAIPAGEQFFDLVFNETAPTLNEGLFAYDLYIKSDSPAIRLTRAVKPDNWVFSAPGASFQQADFPGHNPPGEILVNAIGDLLGATQDILSGTKAARVFYTIDANAGCFGVAHIFLDQTPGTTLFVSGDTGEAIPVDMSDSGSIITCPEPGGLAWAALAGHGGIQAPSMKESRRYGASDYCAIRTGLADLPFLSAQPAAVSAHSPRRLRSSSTSAGTS
jgi:hypothetical protein